MPKQKEDNVDNGMTIVDMNVEGMPWYNKDRRSKKANSEPTQQFTRSEARRYNFYSILAGLVVVLVFSVTWILFTLFATQIWFK